MNKRIFVVAVAALLVAATGLLPARAVGKDPVKPGWFGKWDTNHGCCVTFWPASAIYGTAPELYQEVGGRYRYHNGDRGDIQGSIFYNSDDGDFRFEGTYSGSQDEGRFAIYLRRGHKKFYGTFRGSNKSGRWLGSKISNLPPPR